MLKYKLIVFEILIASFIMQFFGLVTPLFTQVILDKVLTHHSISTLKVIAIAFLRVIIFEMLLSLCRNYIFAHTTTKIDAKLEASFFHIWCFYRWSILKIEKLEISLQESGELDSIRDFIANKKRNRAFRYTF